MSRPARTCLAWLRKQRRWRHLESKLQGLIPELLELNAGLLPEARVPSGQWTDVPMILLSQHISKMRLHA